MPDSAKVKVLPPIVLLTALGIGILIGLLLPTAMLPKAAASAIGVAVVAASAILALLAVKEIRGSKTTLDVRHPTTSIVTTGVFHFTRNPIYLSMVLLYVGAAFLINSPWMLLIALPLGSALCVMAIKPEERYLEGKFGDTYRAYRATVRRWI